MKKFLLLGTVLASSILSINAQSSYGTLVGKTYYDLPSNSSVANRVVYNEDDKSVSVTWIQSITELAQPAFERGAGYNHYRPADGWIYGEDGACRVNNACSGEYSGWPEILNFPKQDLVGANGTTTVSKEIILAHSSGLKKTMRYYRSDSAWRPTKKLLFDQGYCAGNTEGFWPRALTEGTNYIHMVATHTESSSTTPIECGTYSKVGNVFLYSRSSDQGETWDIKNYVLPGLEDTSFFTRGGGDGQALAVNDKYVAILAGGYDQPWVMWKSSDRGLSWNYTVIRDWDPNVYDDKAFFQDGSHARAVSDNAHAVVIDNDGTVHCFSGVSIGSIDAVTGEYGGSSTFGNSGIWYWNDKFDDFCEPTYIAEVVDYVDANGTPHSSPKLYGDAGYDAFDGMAQLTSDAGYFASSTTMPNAAYDDNGGIYVVYSSDVEGTSTETDLANGMATRDIYLVYSKDKGRTWSKEINLGEYLGQDVFGDMGAEEDVYPSVAHHIGSDNILHIVFNTDYKPGSDVQLETKEFSQQFQSYVGLDVTTLPSATRAVVVASPNTITQIEDTLNTSDKVFEFDVAEGYYTTLSPSVVYYDTTFTDIKCDTCPDYKFKDTAYCIVDSNCTALFLHADTIVLGNVNGKDSVMLIDTFFYRVDTTLKNVNTDGDSLYTIPFTTSDQYTVTAVYGNACPDPTTTFNVINIGGPLTAKVLGGMDTMEICPGTSVTLTGIGGGGTGMYTYKWNGTVSANGSTTVTPTTSTMYVFDVDGGAQDSIYISVFAATVALDAGTDETLTYALGSNNKCVEPSTILGGTAVTNMSYSWSPQVGMSDDDAITSDPTVLPKKTTTYYLTTTSDITGCSAVDSVTITVTGECYPLSVSEQEALNFNISVYPNPSTDVVNVEVGHATINTISVYNNLGKIVEVIDANNSTVKAINTSNYTTGIYYLFVQTSKGEITKQFTIVE